jgi:LPXTG-motif cell wall-anchored protein
MSNARSTRRRAAFVATLVASLALVTAAAAPAGADPIGAGEASAFGGQAQLTDQDALPPTALAESDLASEDATASAIGIPADPLLVSGTLNASAAVHTDSDLTSSLTEVTQAVEGPYNAKALGSVEEAEVLVDAVEADVSLLTVGAVRAEAVAVCRAGVVDYSANSEILQLNIGGEPVPLNAPLQDLIDGINDVLTESTLDQVVDVERNVITESADGISVDALVITVLSAAGDVPLATVRLGHAEVSGVACGTPPECSDGIDNDGDGLADADDPGCHTDGDASNPDSYDPNDDSELDEAAAPAAPGVSDNTESPASGQLPATGGNAAATAGLAGAMAAGALGLVALRRRMI